ncbi:HNH endonuclease domain-containing protein [Mycobacterium tuberculosis]|nr:HNH endonuclease domain-containing protein [Mycobacterium tuberculosis]
MSSTATSGAAVVSPAERVEVLFEELAELAGQRNAIDGRIVEIVAELDRDGLWGVTGARPTPLSVSMVGSLISLSRVPLAPAGAEPEPSISLRGDDGTAPGVDSGWPELSDPAAMMNSCPRPRRLAQR